MNPLFKQFVVGLASILLASTAPLQAQTTKTPSATPQLLVLGDSLSAEYGLPRGSGWVGLLQNQLRKDGSVWQVANASISGETTAGGLSRLPDLLKRIKPRLVIIELGANDALRGLSLSSTQKNLKEMIVMSKKSGAEVLLLGMQIPPNYGQEYTKQFARLFVTLSQSEQVPLLPFFLEGVATRPELFQADRIHPNEQAQPILFNNVWKALEPYRELLKTN